MMLQFLQHLKNYYCNNNKVPIATTENHLMQHSKHPFPTTTMRQEEEGRSRSRGKERGEGRKRTHT
jgi:hypothetical protein